MNAFNCGQVMAIILLLGLWWAVKDKPTRMGIVLGYLAALIPLTIGALIQGHPQ
jgi:hypothetical protein